MASRQPEWKTISSSDYMAVKVDTTGVYPPEMVHVDDLGESAEELDGQFLVHRFPLDRCTFVNGILSDNQFHPELAAWFADKLPEIANSCGMPLGILRAMLCSDDANHLAIGYDAIGSYYGFDEFDEYPEYMTEAEATEALN